MSITKLHKPFDITLDLELWREMTRNETVREYAIKIFDYIFSFPCSFTEKKCINAAYFNHLNSEEPEKKIQEHPKFVETLINKQSLIEEIKSKNKTTPFRSIASLENHLEPSKVQKFSDILLDFGITLKPGMQYRDVGGGNGVMAIDLAKRSGIADTSNVKVYEVAQYKDSVCEVVSYNADGTIPESDNSIDFVTMNMVLHHVENPNALLEELYRVMKPGSFFVMRETDTEENPGIDFFQHFMDHHWYKTTNHSETVKGVPLKMKFLSGNQIKELFRSNGFKLIEQVTHKADSTNVFHPRFFIFYCDKNHY